MSNDLLGIGAGVSSLVDFSRTSAVVAVGGISLGVISYVAAKALGLGSTVTTIATAIPVSIGALGIGCAALGFGYLACIGFEIHKALGRHL